MFNVMLIDDLDKDRSKKNNRLAVRGIIVRNDKKILMLKSTLGDYRLPGGAVELGETLEKSLKREIEEVGLDNIIINKHLGKTTRIKNDKKDKNATIEMINHYFLCFLDESYDYNEHLNFSHETNMEIEWIFIRDALKNNKKIFEKYKDSQQWMKNSFPIFKAIINVCNEVL